MDVINRGAASINEGIAYLRSNAWPIVFCLALWFLVRPQGKIDNNCVVCCFWFFETFRFPIDLSCKVILYIRRVLTCVLDFLIS